MPYEISFAKVIDVVDPAKYINKCCFGGDVVIEQLLPILKAKFGAIEAEQEDWGWFAWFSTGSEKLAVDVFSDEPYGEQFRIHLTTRVPRLLLGYKVADTTSLEELRDIVLGSLTSWTGEPPTVVRLDAKYIPL